jgi:thiamine-phosphate pyrophosphorylase
MLIAISYHELLTGEAQIIQQLFKEGLECFHLRKPDASEDDIRQLLRDIPAEYHNRIALHSCHQLAGEFDIQRLHFTEQAREQTLAEGDATLQTFIRKGYRLSTSVHNIKTLCTLPALFSYAFFGPVFNSISKENYNGIIDSNFFVSAEYKSVPVIALGGIDAENISKVAAMNFDGAAVLGALWTKPEKAVGNFKLLKMKWRILSLV